ncbi:MAG TPA: hypothetical protein VNF07_04870 [Acidimicrobiales bacterium]|nr:hypothetical protein [Acidimicrobiales bacterium]
MLGRGHLGGLYAGGALVVASLLAGGGAALAAVEPTSPKVVT